jgi:hypothetical protein
MAWISLRSFMRRSSCVSSVEAAVSFCAQQSIHRAKLVQNEGRRFLATEMPPVCSASTVGATEDTKFYTGFDSLGHSAGHSSILIRGTELASIGLSRMGDCGLCCKKMSICVAKQGRGHWQAASLMRENLNLRELPPRTPRCRCDLDALGGSCGLGHGASGPGGENSENNNGFLSVLLSMLPSTRPSCLS